MAAKHVASFGPSELTFVLDGMARLRVKAPTKFLTALAKQVAFKDSLDITAFSNAQLHASFVTSRCAICMCIVLEFYHS